MTPIGKGNAWIEFRGIKNTDVGVRLLSMPTRMHPAAKGRLIDVEGRDGKLWLPENAYDRITIGIQLCTGPDADIDAVSAWLMGEGALIFGDEPLRAYHARITKEYLSLIHI